MLLLALGPYLKEQFQEELAGIKGKAGLPLHSLLLASVFCQLDYFLFGGFVVHTWLLLILYPIAIYCSAKVASREGIEPYVRFPTLMGIFSAWIYLNSGWFTPIGMGLLVGFALAIGISQHLPKWEELKTRKPEAIKTLGQAQNSLISMDS